MLSLIVERALRGEASPRADLDFLEDSPALDELVEAAHLVTTKCASRVFNFCTIVNAKSGRCAEDCRWCSQSSKWTTNAPVFPIVPATRGESAAARALEHGIRRLSFVTSGRKLSARELREIRPVVEAAASTGLEVCASMGLLTEPELTGLREAGLVRYHCNLETGPDFFPKVCTTHTQTDKIRTLEAARRAVTALAVLMTRVKSTGEELSVDDIQWHFVGHDDEYRSGAASDPEGAVDDVDLKVRRRDLQGRTPNQRLYLKAIMGHDISFGVGPAGTGKTFLAVAAAVDAFERGTVERIVLTRPAVEAGERLGFLPGDLTQKVDPYLRPLYDALFDLMGFEKSQRLMERQSIEVAPLAYMRGRTLNNAFVILDEAQNTTPEQMKMFLTRIGFGSKAVITGDVTQIDLPKGVPSGLKHAIRILDGVRGIEITRFTSKDVVRHPLVARIVDAYEEAAKQDELAAKARKEVKE